MKLCLVEQEDVSRWSSPDHRLTEECERRPTVYTPSVVYRYMALSCSGGIGVLSVLRLRQTEIKDDETAPSPPSLSLLLTSPTP